MKKKEDERRQYSVSDTGILGEKELLSAYNRSQIYDLWISMLDALPQWVVWDLWQARLLTYSMMTNFLYTVRIGMLFRVPWNKQLGLVITHTALTKVTLAKSFTQKLPWPKVLLKSYLGQKFYSEVTLAKSFTQRYL